MRECGYDIDIKTQRKVRDGILCEGPQGVFLKTAARCSENRLAAIRRLQEHLLAENGMEIDLIQKTEEGNYTYEGEDGSRYVVKQWFLGRECDLNKESEILCAIKTLVNLHDAMRKKIDWGEVQVKQGEDLQQLLERRNRELKKTRSFMRKKVDKNEFERLFLQNFERIYELGAAACENLKTSSYRKIPKHLIHGDYNYHNILLVQNKMIVVNFEHFEENIQVMDLYYFLRKVMEKHQWNVKLGEKIINTYVKYGNLSAEEMECLGICLLYPEKFWKIANSYARAKKTWIPAKNVEKLQLVVEQTKEKQKFMEKVLKIK